MVYLLTKDGVVEYVDVLHCLMFGSALVCQNPIYICKSGRGAGTQRQRGEPAAGGWTGSFAGGAAGRLRGRDRSLCPPWQPGTEIDPRRIPCTPPRRSPSSTPLKRWCRRENGGKVRLNIHLPRLESDSADAAREATDPDVWDICIEMNWNALPAVWKRDRMVGTG